MQSWKTTANKEHLLVEFLHLDSRGSIANNRHDKTSDMFSSFDAAFDWLELELLLE
jgi:hypothetical protein